MGFESHGIPEHPETGAILAQIGLIGCDGQAVVDAALRDGIEEAYGSENAPVHQFGHDSASLNPIRSATAGRSEVALVSTRITRAILMDTPLSIDKGEVTDKGSINQRAVLEHRSLLIEELYAANPSDRVISVG